jgi:hypothetical protein
MVFSSFKAGMTTEMSISGAIVPRSGCETRRHVLHLCSARA